MAPATTWPEHQDEDETVGEYIIHLFFPTSVRVNLIHNAMAGLNSQKRNNNFYIVNNSSNGPARFYLGKRLGQNKPWVNMQDFVLQEHWSLLEERSSVLPFAAQMGDVSQMEEVSQIENIS